MRNDIEKRLHRVKIHFKGTNVKCDFSKQCDVAQEGDRCNLYYTKCSNYLHFKNISQSV